MPRGDGAGPMGKGRKGRGMGACGGSPDFAGKFQGHGKGARGTFCLRADVGPVVGNLSAQEGLSQRKKMLEEELARVNAQLAGK